MAADTDQTLETVAGVWAELLGVKRAKIGPGDNFFALGGHSLMAVKLIALVQEKTGLGGELQLSALSDYPTLGAFAAHVAELSEPGEESGEI